MTVANAAPWMPMAGTPSQPKMNTPLSTMFTTTATELMVELSVVCPVFFIRAK